MTGAGGNPFLVDVIVDHHAGTGGRDTLLWSLVTETRGGWWWSYFGLRELQQTKTI